MAERLGRSDVRQLLTELTCSEFDDWFKAITQRPYHLDPVRYYGNQTLALLWNINTTKQHRVSPETLDIYFIPEPVEQQDWRSMKAAMNNVQGVTRTQDKR